MLLVTSIMYNENDVDIKNQKQAIDTWAALGARVISTNTNKEIRLLKNMFDNVVFVELERTGEKQYGKPVPYIVDMLAALYEYSKNDEVCGIINSDIYLRNLECIGQLEEAVGAFPNRLLCLHRYDIEIDAELDGEYYFSGIDAFFMKRNYLRQFPDAGFALGRPEWDHWMVHEALMHGMQIAEVKEAIAFHVRHKQRWSATESNERGKSVQGNNHGEEYYCVTNRALQDISNRIMLKKMHMNRACRWEEREHLYLEEDATKMALVEMERHKTNAVKFPLGMGYFKGAKFFRVCAAHRNQYWENEITVHKEAIEEILAVRVGEIVGYIDFMETEVAQKLGRFYLYPAGRAARALLDGLLEHGKVPLGMVDRDVNIQGECYMGVNIYDTSVLKQQEDYDNVLVVSNLYVDEICRDLSLLIPSEKLIVI